MQSFSYRLVSQLLKADQVLLLSHAFYHRYWFVPSRRRSANLKEYASEAQFLFAVVVWGHLLLYNLVYTPKYELQQAMNVIIAIFHLAADFPIVTSTLLFTFCPEISVSSLRMTTTKPVVRYMQMVTLSLHFGMVQRLQKMASLTTIPTRGTWRWRMIV